MKIITGLHYESWQCGKKAYLALRISGAYTWQITDQTKDARYADIPGTLDQVCSNDQHNHVKAATVLVTNHYQAPAADQIVKQLKQNEHPIKPVKDGLHQHPRIKVQKRLDMMYKYYLKLHDKEPMLFSNAKYLLCTQKGRKIFKLQYADGSVINV